jgi:hypothetical protein
MVLPGCRGHALAQPGAPDPCMTSATGVGSERGDAGDPWPASGAWAGSYSRSVRRVVMANGRPGGRGSGQKDSPPSRRGTEVVLEGENAQTRRLRGRAEGFMGRPPLRCGFRVCRAPLGHQASRLSGADPGVPLLRSRSLFFPSPGSFWSGLDPVPHSGHMLAPTPMS